MQGNDGGSTDFTGVSQDLKEIAARKVLLKTIKGSTKIRWCSYSSYFRDEDIEAKRNSYGTKKRHVESNTLSKPPSSLAG